MIMHPAVRYHMVISSRQPYAGLLLSAEAERYIGFKSGHYI